QRLVAHQVGGLASGQRTRLRSGRAQAALDRRKEARGATESGEHALLRLVEAASQEARRLAPMAPDLIKRHEQTGVIGRLEHVLKSPRFVWRGGITIRRNQSEAQAKRVVSPGLSGEIGPVAHLAPQRLRAIALQVHSAVFTAERADPGADRRRPPGDV